MPRSKESFRLEVADRLHSAAIHLLRHARKQDMRSSAGPARLSALSVLVFGGPIALGKLANAEQVKAPTMSRIVAGLERSGLAKIVTDTKDGRRIQVTATAKGKHLLQQAKERRVELVAETLRGMDGAELEALLRAAKLVEDAVGRSQQVEGAGRAGR